MFNHFNIRLNPAPQPLNYYSTLWLLAVQLVVMLPFLFYLPLWLLPLMLFSAGWRIRALKGHQAQPNLITKITLWIFGIVALVISGLSVYSLDMMAAFLLLTFIYKLLETVARRDALIVLFTAYLLIAIQFLYSQTLFAAAYGVFSLIIITAALISLQQETLGIRIAMKVNMRLSAFVIVAGVPLMVLLFFFVPRLPPLWSVPSATNPIAKTGITDRMTPGDIAHLSQSDALAFRVSFKSERPPQKALYWRGLVLDNFDGKTWQATKQSAYRKHIPNTNTKNQATEQSQTQTQTQASDYEIIFEASAQSWLFSLASVRVVTGEANIIRDHRVVANKPLMEPLIVKFSSTLNQQREVLLAAKKQKKLLQLPTTGNIKSQQFAQRLYKAANNNTEYVSSVMQYFQQQNFAYTLHPSAISNENSIDSFLFEQQKGFCAHYASSFVYLMRAAGIPARVVVGYQGGEWNEKGQYLAIHQYDAHAWAEVWLENQGWVRQDPTAMIAPDRIEQSLEIAVAEEGSFLQEQTFSLTKVKWLTGLRKHLDSIEYGWRRWVLAYNEDTQASLLKRLFKEKNILPFVLYALLFSVLLLLLWAIYIRYFKSYQHEALEHRLYRRFCRIIYRFLGLKRATYQTPNSFAADVMAKYPELNPVVDGFTQAYLMLCYQSLEKKARRHTLGVLRRYFYHLLWQLTLRRFSRHT